MERSLESADGGLLWPPRHGIGCFAKVSLDDRTRGFGDGGGIEMAEREEREPEDSRGEAECLWWSLERVSHAPASVSAKTWFGAAETSLRNAQSFWSILVSVDKGERVYPVLGIVRENGILRGGPVCEAPGLSATSYGLARAVLCSEPSYKALRRIALAWHSGLAENSRVKLMLTLNVAGGGRNYYPNPISVPSSLAVAYSWFGLRNVKIDFVSNG